MPKSPPYQNLCAEFYHLDKPSFIQEDLRYYLYKASELGGPILEPMCGTGNYLVPLLKEGFSITGFDSSSSMLDICRDKCKKEGLFCEVKQAGFSDFHPKELYKLIMIPNGSFCLLTEKKEALLSLGLLHKWLDPKGKLLLEIITTYAESSISKNWTARWVKKEDGSMIVLNEASDLDTKSSIKTVLCRYEHWKDNQLFKTEVEEFCVRLYEPEETEDLLEKQGFQIEKRLDSQTLKPAGPKAPFVLYECNKALG